MNMNPMQVNRDVVAPKTVNTIKAVKKKQWDALTDANSFISYAWLLTIEQTSLNNLKPLYILLYERDILIGGAACFIKNKSSDNANLDNWFFGRSKKYFNQFGISFFPALICCPEKCYGSHILVGKQFNSEEKQYINAQIFNLIEKEASSRKLSIIFPNVINKEKELIPILKKNGYQETVGTPLNYIDINWNDFEEYKQHIKNNISKNAYADVKRDINKNRKAGVKINEVKSVENYGSRPFELINGNCLKNNQCTFPYREEFFEKLKANFKDDCNFYIAVKNSELISIAVVLKSGRYYYGSFIGVDHELSGDNRTYFNICYYRPISDAISNNIKRIYYGNALYETKRRRGGELEETSIYFKPYRSSFTIFTKLWFSIHSSWMRNKLPKI